MAHKLHHFPGANYHLTRSGKIAVNNRRARCVMLHTEALHNVSACVDNLILTPRDITVVRAVRWHKRAYYSNMHAIVRFVAVVLYALALNNVKQ